MDTMLHVNWDNILQSTKAGGPTNAVVHFNKTISVLIMYKYKFLNSSIPIQILMRPKLSEMKEKVPLIRLVPVVINEIGEL